MPKFWISGKSGGYLIECKDIDFVLPGDSVKIMSTH